MLTLPTGRPSLDQGLPVLGHLRPEMEGVAAGGIQAEGASDCNNLEGISWGGARRFCLGAVFAFLEETDNGFLLGASV